MQKGSRAQAFTVVVKLGTTVDCYYPIYHVPSALELKNYTLCRTSVR